jgi:hypothetical protein
MHVMRDEVLPVVSSDGGSPDEIFSTNHRATPVTIIVAQIVAQSGGENTL